MEFYYLSLLLYSALVISGVWAMDLCPDGSFILGRGLSLEDRKAATDEHNRFRQMLVDGVAPGQPRAKYMKTMIYDEILEEKCVPVSDQCLMNHLPVTDERWHCVGQNIYITCHSQFSLYQNWTAALASWFYECNDFQYPDIDLTGADVGHYTQVAWADSDTLGCDYILFIDPRKQWMPFCSMYTCNYGPCGNYNGLPPYELADDSNCNSENSSSKQNTSEKCPCKSNNKSNDNPSDTTPPKQKSNEKSSPEQKPSDKHLDEKLKDKLLTNIADKHAGSTVQNLLLGILGKRNN